MSVVSPGYIRTNLSVNAVTGDGSKYGGEAVKQVRDCVSKKKTQCSCRRKAVHKHSVLLLNNTLGLTRCQVVEGDVTLGGSKIATYTITKSNKHMSN